MTRDISRAIHRTKAELSHGTEVLSCIFSKGNAMMISICPGNRRHVVVEAEWDGVSEICRRGAEFINTF